MNPNNILLEKEGVIFFLVAKAANSSIKAALQRMWGKQVTANSLHRGWNRIDPCEAKEKRDHHKIAVVRNPWDRVVSCYYQKILGGGKAGFFSMHEFSRDMSFEAFIEAICSMPDATEPHIRSQTLDMVCDGELVPEWVIKFEGLGRQWPEVQKILPVPDLEHRNRSTHPHYRKCYSRKTRKMIAQRYSQDIEKLGYEF